MSGAVSKDEDARERLSKVLEQMKDADPFRVLGVPLEADDRAVRLGYLNAIKTYHPNRFARQSQESRDLANEIFLLVHKAYQQIRVESARQFIRARQLGGQGDRLPVSVTPASSSSSSGDEQEPLAAPRGKQIAGRRPATVPPGAIAAGGATAASFQSTSQITGAKPGTVPPVKPATTRPATSPPASGSASQRQPAEQPAKPGTNPPRPGHQVTSAAGSQAGAGTAPTTPPGRAQSPGGAAGKTGTPPLGEAQRLADHNSGTAGTEARREPPATSSVATDGGARSKKSEGGSTLRPQLPSIPPVAASGRSSTIPPDRQGSAAAQTGRTPAE
ncbi:MAG: hypothetical protein V2A73_04410, partial [Pseudomonadota bacterium]